MVGIVMMLTGLTIACGALAVDWVSVGNWDRVGPAQQLAIAVGLATAILGLSLIPLGDRPA